MDNANNEQMSKRKFAKRMMDEFREYEPGIKTPSWKTCLDIMQYFDNGCYDGIVKDAILHRIKYSKWPTKRVDTRVGKHNGAKEVNTGSVLLNTSVRPDVKNAQCKNCMFGFLTDHVVSKMKDGGWVRESDGECFECNYLPRAQSQRVTQGHFVCSKFMNRETFDMPFVRIENGIANGGL